MRSTLAVCAAVCLVAVGCSASFDGEWLENAGQHDTGNQLTTGGERRMALKFEPPALVRYGLYLDRTQVVDEQSVQTSRYFTFEGDKVAQFGAMTARVDGDHLMATVQGGPERYFTRVKGKSIFPPDALLPPVGQANDQSAREAVAAR